MAFLFEIKDSFKGVEYFHTQKPPGGSWDMRKKGWQVIMAKRRFCANGRNRLCDV